jgi:acid phosphatase family membrane protein YuiD
MHEWAYPLCPFLAWLAAGGLKFVINCFREKRLALDLIGYGGLPSNHAAITSSTCALVGLREGVDSPAFGVALTLTFIVLIDAGGLRRHVGRHAEAINRVVRSQNLPMPTMRQRIGHSRLEIGSGVILGLLIAWGLQYGSTAI